MFAINEHNVFFNNIRDFLSGKPYAPDGCDAVLTRFFGESDQKYLDAVEKIKSYLNSSRHYYYKGVFLIKNKKQQLTEKELATLVRFIKITRPSVLCVVVNDDFVYADPKVEIQKNYQEARCYFSKIVVKIERANQDKVNPIKKLINYYNNMTAKTRAQKALAASSV